MKRFALPIIALALLCGAPSVAWPQNGDNQEQTTPVATPQANPWERYAQPDNAEHTSVPTVQSTPSGQVVTPFDKPRPTPGQPTGETNGETTAPADQANPWDKYTVPENPASGREHSPQPAVVTPNQGGSNPWDRYAPSTDEQPAVAPEAKQVQQPAAAKEAKQPSKRPWEKYPESEASDDQVVVTGGSSAPDSQGSNPWDKYTPAVDEPDSDVADTPQTPATEPQTPSAPLEPGQNPWDRYVLDTPAQSNTQAAPAPANSQATQLPLAAPIKVRPMPTAKLVVKNDLPINQESYFAIAYNGALVGYSRYKVDRLLVLGGKSTYLLDSSTRIKIGSERVQDLTYQSTTQINKRDLAPSSFQCAQHSKEQNYELNCIFSANLIAQRNRLGQSDQTSLQDFTDDTPHLLLNNLWGQLDTFAEHYWLLVRSAADGGVVKAYDPILQGMGQIIVYAPVKEAWKHNGRSYTTLLYCLSDLQGQPLAYVRLAANSLDLLEIREIGSGLTFTLSNSAVTDMVAKQPGVKLLGGELRTSNVHFSDPDQLSSLTADVDISLRGGELSQHKASGYSQQFFGEIKEGRLKGRAQITTNVSATPSQSAFPFTETIPEDLVKYTRPGVGIESSLPGIINKAREVSWKSENAFQAIRRLTGFVAKQIENGVSLPSARQAMETGVGNAESKALLLVAMARTLNIPARTIGGVAYDQGQFAPHYWAEVWLGEKEGWVPFDPTTNEAGFINASHLALSESGDVQNLRIKVRKFAPHPARRVAYFETPLKWPIGEKRTYAITRDGRRIGTEQASMYDMETIKGQDIYHFRASTELLDNPDEAPAAAPVATPKPTAQASGDTASSAEPDEQTGLAANLDQASNPAAKQNEQKPESQPASSLPADQAPESAAPKAPETAPAENVPSATTDNQAAAASSAGSTEAAPAPKKVTRLDSEAVLDAFGLPIYFTCKNSDSPLIFKETRVVREVKDGAQVMPQYIPYSKGTYLADQRFLSMWALVVEQLTLGKDAQKEDSTGSDGDAESYSFSVFIPETLRTQELVLDRSDSDETVTMPDGQEIDVVKLETEKGMVFYVDQKNRVIKLAIPSQQIELVLEKTEFDFE